MRNRATHVRNGAGALAVTVRRKGDGPTDKQRLSTFMRMD
jgi:hypothetical protein